MPRQPKNRTPLAILRQIIGQTQKQMAEALGMSPHTYQSLELGKRTVPMTRERAELLLELTGVHPASLDASFSKIPLNMGRKPYTRADYGRWRKMRYEPGARERAAQVAGWLELLFEAGQNLKKLEPLFLRACAMVDQLRSEFELERETQRVLNGRKITQPIDAKEGRITYGFMRSNPEIAKAIGFKEDKWRDDADIVEKQALNITVTPPWFPSGGPVPPPGKRPR